MDFTKDVPIAFILHAYQPITQTEQILERIVNKCYEPFFTKLLENPQIKITLNISGCLVEKLENDYPQIINLVNKSISAGQIEMMGSAYYHALLPLLTKDEQNYQITKQQMIIQEVFDILPTSFFPPELAISPTIFDSLTLNGFENIIAPSNVFLEHYGGILKVKNDKSISIIKRNKILSNSIAFNGYYNNSERALKDILHAFQTSSIPVVLAMDLETFGEHHENYFNFFFELMNELQSIQVSELSREYKITEQIGILQSTSWSTDDVQLKMGIHFPLWDHPQNSVHQLLHSHLELLRQIKQKVSLSSWLEEYHASFYSCQFWWGSKEMWNKKLVLTGLDFQRKTLENIVENLPESDKKMIINLSDNIIKRVKKCNLGKEK